MKKFIIVTGLIFLLLTPFILADVLNNSINPDSNLTIQNNSEENSSMIDFEENGEEESQETNQEDFSGDLYYCPQNDGYIGEIADENMHDSGQSGAGDSLEVYCRNNIIRLCLSEEPCSWRNSISSNDQSTCNGYYGSSPMAFSANEIGINLANLIGTGDRKIENIYCNSEYNGYPLGWSVEFSETNKNNQSSSGAGANATQSGCFNGCLYQDSCIPFGYRLKNEQGESVYCDISHELKIQKSDDGSCQNDFECLSGDCINGLCVDLQKGLAETTGRVVSLESKVEESNTLLQKIVNFLKRLFGFE